MRQMRDRVLLVAATLIASSISDVGILVTKYPLLNAAETLSTRIEGVYTRSHEVSAVDGGVEIAEDVVEIVRYDATHVFVQILGHFDNGHSCGLSGIASFEDESFVYRTRQFILDGEPTCTLKVATDRRRASSHQSSQSERNSYLQRVLRCAGQLVGLCHCSKTTASNSGPDDSEGLSGVCGSSGRDPQKTQWFENRNAQVLS